MGKFRRFFSVAIVAFIVTLGLRPLHIELYQSLPEGKQAINAFIALVL